MKHPFKLIVSLIVFGFLFSNQTVEAQFLEKLKKNVEKAAEDAVIRKAEKKTEKEVDDIFDKKEKEINRDEKKSKEVLGSEKETTIEKKSLEVYRNYKFIPGEKVIFYDDLKTEEVGEFPSR